MKSSTESAEIAALPRAARTEHRPGARPEAEGTRADGLWDVRDVAAYLKLPVGAIYKMTAKAAFVRIPHIHLGGCLRFRRTDIDRWLCELTISNIESLTHARKRARGTVHGHNP